MAFIVMKPSGKRKKRKPTAKQRDLIANWQGILEKYEVSNKVKHTKKKSNYKLEVPRKVTHHPSLNSSGGSTTKPEPKVYTGDAMLGIATMHKSNSVPVFKVEDAKDISKMRR